MWVAVLWSVPAALAWSLSGTSLRPRLSRRATLDDVSGDGGVVKLRSSGGGERRLFGDDGAVARMRYSAYGASGQLLASSEDIIYTVGDPAWLRGLDSAVRSMAVGESADFECSAAYAYGSEGVPPAVAPGETISLHLHVLDYRGNVATSSTFAQDKPLTPRTATEIRDEYERRRRLRAEEEPDDETGPIAKAIAKFRTFYFFGFFESQTGEEAPWFLRPIITFPAIFLVVGLSTYWLLTNDIILLKGEGPTIPGETPFEL